MLFNVENDRIEINFFFPVFSTMIFDKYDDFKGVQKSDWKS